jgi:hypothetical protein
VLSQNNEAWTEIEKELAEWDATLGDGLESDSVKESVIYID